MKNLIITSITILLATLIISSCNTIGKNDLIGKGFSIEDSYHRVRFINASKYEIYQNTNAGKSCVGEGNWSLKEGIITLYPNNSNCSTTQNIKGKYHVSEKWLEK